MPIPKLIFLHERLFVRGHTRHCNLETLFQVMISHGVGYVLNVALIPDPDLKEIMVDAGLVYRHAPMSDAQFVERSRVIQLAHDVADAMTRTAVLVHCDSGWNRSYLVAIIAWHLFTDRPIDDLIAEARASRPKMLKNPAFERFVRSVGVSGGVNDV